MFERSRRCCATGCLLVLAGACAAAAQTTDEVNSGIQLNFTPPGARSLGMGGAFIAVATDATAAVSNPAGLTQLTESEISIELLVSDFSHTYADGGAIFGEPTGIGINTVAGLQEREAENQTVGASYISGVLRPKVENRWTLAAFRHELANFRASYRREGAFVGPFDLPDGGTWPANGLPARTRPAIMEMDLQIDSYGLAGAYELIDDTLSLGVVVAINDFTIDASTERFSSKGGRLFEPPDYSPENLRVIQVQQGSDVALSFSAGYLWRLTDNLSMGGVVRLGPEFDYEARRVLGPQSDADDTFLVQPAKFHVPDLFGFGFAYRVPNTCSSWEGQEEEKARETRKEPCLRVAVEWDRVGYSKMTNEITSPFDTSGPMTLDSLTGRTAFVEVEDGSEYHIGAEYTFKRTWTSLRAGAWLDPDHRFAVKDPRTAADQRASAFFRPGEDTWHYSVGAGWKLNDCPPMPQGEVCQKQQRESRRNENEKEMGLGRQAEYHIDFAIDYSEALTTFTISTVVRY